MSDAKPGKKRFFKKEKKTLQPKRHKAPSSKAKVIFSAKTIEKKEGKKLPQLQFPKNLRFITERFDRLRASSFGTLKTKEISASRQEAGKLPIKPTRKLGKSYLRKRNFWLSGILICSVGFALFLSIEHWRTWSQWHRAQQAHDHVVQELRTWEDVAGRYPTYRDAYFEAAVLAYQLGENEKELQYLQKTLSIDPNFAPVQELKTLSK